MTCSVGCCCKWIWDCSALVILIIAAVLFGIYIGQQCSQETHQCKYQVEPNNTTLVFVRGCPNQDMLDTLLAVSLSIGTAACVAILSHLRRCTWYCRIAYVLFLCQRLTAIDCAGSKWNGYRSQTGFTSALTPSTKGASY